MERNYNYQAFTPEEVKKGLLNDLLNYLLDHNKKNTYQYYDIHITTDGYCSIIEWTDVSYNNEYGEDGKFRFVDYDQVIMTEKTFPDNHTELCYDEEDYQERLNDFLKDNPDWVKTSYGTWTNLAENRYSYLHFVGKDLAERKAKEDTIAWETKVPAGISKENYSRGFMAQVLHLAKEDSVINRTDYIVMGRTALDLAKFDIKLKKNFNYDDSHVAKAGVYKATFVEPTYDENEEPNTRVEEIPVYYCEEAKNDVWFLTDNGYLMYKIHVDEVDE